MVVGEVPEAADLVVAGAGPGGYAAALHGARRGRQVMLVDRTGRDGVGGVCLREGCIPSKALIETATLFRGAADGAERGVVASALHADLEAFQAFKRRLVGGLTDGVRSLLDAAGVEVVSGELSLIDETTAVIAQPGDRVRFVAFSDLVIATGSSAIELPGLPFDGEGVLDSSAVLELDALPSSLGIIGAGYIGVEIGIALAKLGTRVSVVEAADRVLPELPAHLGAPVARRMAALGIEVLLDTRARSFGAGRLAVDSPGGSRRVEVEAVMAAVGRAPALGSLNLSAAGIEPGPDGRLAVDPDRRLRPHIAAIGDLTPGPALAHKATAEAVVAVDALCGDSTAFEPAAIPVVVFSDPEIASVGEPAGPGCSSARFPVGASGRAATLGESLGFVEVVSDAEDGTILGVHIVAPHASELIAEGALAVEMGATLEDLALTIHPHPTLSEMLGEGAAIGAGRPLHVRQGAR